MTMTEPAWRPSPRARWLWAIDAALLWLVPFGAQVAWAIADGWATTRHVAVFAASLVLAVAHVVGMPIWRYHVHRWEISDAAVYARSGWFTQERRIAPISRIQTVDTKRGPTERMLGLATVTVTTASSAGAVEIVGLEQRLADETAARLTEIAARNVGDAL